MSIIRWMPGRLMAALALGSTTFAADPVVWQEIVHPRVVQEATEHGEAEFVIFLDEQADLSPLAELSTKLERGTRAHELLRDVASVTQAPLLAWLEQRGVPHRSYWIANMIWARADLDTIASIAARTEVRRLDANPSVRFSAPFTADADELAQTTGVIEWGILKTRADQVWALGYDGTGIVVAGQDTGYDWTHPALVEHYRGWDGSSADHDYNWHDAIHIVGGICGADSPVPCDDHNHGTHTMGTMVGDDGGGNRIGMAPGAEWMGCRNMSQGDGTPASYSECFEFFVAPTDLTGSNPDPAKAPHVINNSWSCPPSEGCSHDTLRTVVENTRAAGILVVVSAGNSGSGCESIDDPPAIYDASFTIGATDSSDNIAGFSSRGPVTIDDSGRLKPDLSGPGVSVRSCVPGGGYQFFSGTSMAAPHVTGAVALLLDAREDLIGNVTTVEQLIRLSAFPRTSTQECGGIPGTEIPNPVYGHGRLDALFTVTGDADGDGVANLSDCSPTNGDVWAPPGPTAVLELVENDLLTVLSWAPAAGGSIARYDVLRSTSPDDFADPVCVAAGSPNTGTFDAEDPQSIFFYLVRAKNACGSDLGASSGGVPRTGGVCTETP